MRRVGEGIRDSLRSTSRQPWRIVNGGGGWFGDGERTRLYLAWRASVDLIQWHMNRMRLAVIHGMRHEASRH
jgi:hypothetical protein